MKKHIIVSALCVLILLPACDHLALQDMAIKNARKPSIPSSLELKENLNLEFTRGKIVTRFTSILEQGKYKAIIETDSGMFYLAPKRGFAYKTNDRIKSTIGGIFLEKITKKPYVWIAPEELNQSQWELWESGENIDDMLPGFIFIEDRPWVEKDFAIPEGKISIQ